MTSATRSTRRWCVATLLGMATLGLPVLAPPPAGAATLTVTTGANSGAGSLRAAIEASGPGDIISFSPSVTEVNLEGPVYLNGGVTIDGGGTVTVRLLEPGCIACSVLAWNEESPGGTITLRGLTVTGATGGGGVNVGPHPLVITGSTITGNLSGDPGGGVFTERDLTVTDSTITNNVGGQAGGGLAAQGTLTITDTTVTGNEVEPVPGELVVFGGGAASGGDMVATRVIVTNNRATSEGAVSGAFGGGLATVTTTADMVITDSLIAGNTATVNGASAIADGAGAFSNDALEVNTSVIASNTSTATGPSFPTARAGGLASRGDITVTDTRVEDNEALATGPNGNTNSGGIYGYGMTTITDSFVLRNTSRSTGEQADARSGGLYIADPGSTISGTLVAGNIAAGIGAGGRASGGGIATQADLVIEGSEISENSASGSESLFVVGGGVAATFGDLLVVRDSTVSNNSATGNGSVAVPSQGGGLFGTSLQIENSTISGNVTGSEGGGISGSGTLVNSTVSDNSSGMEGSALYAPVTGFDLTFVTVAGNDAGEGATIAVEDVLATRGSAIEGTCTSEVGELESLGGTVATDESCADTEAGDVVVDDLGLEPLEDNGGPTDTQLPVPESPVIAVVGEGCPPPNLDQRGEPRPDGAACDAGAVQLQLPGTPTIDAVTPGDGEVTLGFTGPQPPMGRTLAMSANRGEVIGYEVSSDDGGSWERATVTGEGVVTIGGLTNGTSYLLRLRAVSADGAGPASPAVTATPTAVVIPRFVG